MIITFSGPFCCGKSTLIKKLEDEGIAGRGINDSTRSMRENESQGNPYNFLSETQFCSNVQVGKYLDSSFFNGNRYGIPNHMISNNWDCARDVLAAFVPVIEKNVKNVRDVVSFFLLPPSDRELIRRAKKRGDSEKHIKERLVLGKKENPNNCKYIIQPLSLQEVSNKVLEIIDNHISNLS